ncbi:MAG TPA: ribosome silencing factor [Actinomycetota bacterium]|nr:ribosome silencing factor [Actinomycetota bacterium]
MNERSNGLTSLVLDAAKAASSKKAQDVIVLDVSKLLVITDHFLICSGTSDRQVRTIADEIEKTLREDHSVKPYRREGEREARWVLLDYVDFVVHVFQTADREYYDLERLWADAPRFVIEESEGGRDEPAAAKAT